MFILSPPIGFGTNLDALGIDSLHSPPEPPPSLKPSYSAGMVHIDVDSIGASPNSDRTIEWISSGIS